MFQVLGRDAVFAVYGRGMSVAGSGIGEKVAPVRVCDCKVQGGVLLADLFNEEGVGFYARGGGVLVVGLVDAVLVGFRCGIDGDVVGVWWRSEGKGVGAGMHCQVVVGKRYED